MVRQSDPQDAFPRRIGDPSALAQDQRRDREPHGRKPVGNLGGVGNRVRGDGKHEDRFRARNSRARRRPTARRRHAAVPHRHSTGDPGRPAPPPRPHALAERIARRRLGAGRAARLPAGAGRATGATTTTGARWEARLNEFPQFTTEIDGANVHFLHVHSPEPNALPLILTHGWPGSIVEFMEVIGPLADPAAHGGDPADAFHVVVPSMPGFGFSGPTHETGWDTARIAAAWAELMRRLGYERYGAQGGDWGAEVSRTLGIRDAEHVVGVHLNFLPTFPSGDPAELEGLTEAEQERLARLERFATEESGYFSIQGTRPQTLAYGADRFAGRAARLDRREVQGVDRLGDGPRGRRRPRPDADQRHALLADGDGPVVAPTSTRRTSRPGASRRSTTRPPGWRSSRPRSASRSADSPSRQHQHHPLVGVRSRRPLRGHGGTRSLRRGRAGVFPRASARPVPLSSRDEEDADDERWFSTQT